MNTLSKRKNFATIYIIALVFCALAAGQQAQLAFAASDNADEGSIKNSAQESYQNALTKVKIGRYVAAIEDLKKALDIDKNNAAVWSLYGFAARKAGSYRLAEKAYDQALTLNPNHLGALEYSGELYVETERLDKARERLARIIELCPQGCKEINLLEQAIAGSKNNGAHKAVELKW